MFDVAEVVDLNGCLDDGVLIGVEVLEDVVFALRGIDAFDGLA